MLTELRIANFAVIDQLSLQCSHGFHVLTGETGAGKSIIVDAIALLVGGRAEDGLIRADAEEAVLEAAFTLPPHSPLAIQLRAEGVFQHDETELIVRRVLSRTGRHRLYLNGSLTPLRTIQRLAGTLIDIHGQHEQQSLLSPQAQLDALDAFGHLTGARDEYRRAYEGWRTSQQELDDAKRLASDRTQKEDLLRFQDRELQEADLKAGEEEALLAERHRLAHAQRLNELTQGTYDALYGGETSVLGNLGSVRDWVKELASIDPEAKEWPALCEGATAQLRELVHNLRHYRDGLDQDPARLAQIEERLDRIQRLKKKYGGTESSVLAKREEVQRELEALDGGETRLAELEGKVASQRTRMQTLGERLSRERVKTARKFEAKVADELASLRMAQTRFEIAVESEPDTSGWGPAGCDRAECQFSANPGEPLHPLAKVASGGELSRVMLAVKTVLAEADGVPILIFDEVDAGVGGAVAAVVGRRLRSLGRFHQVFCITHLPQIASQADAHYVVQKETAKKRTVARVRRLDQEGRHQEVARMLGGLTVTKAVRETAAEMLREGEDGR